MENHYFGYKHKISYGIVLLMVLAFVLTSTVTLALFFGSDWASSKVTMSGKVQIEAVGKGTAYESIEDANTSNLMVTLEDNYSVLIPGMDISLDANCKVLKSTTKPHLRADFNMILYDKETGESVGSEYTDEHRFLVDMYADLQSQVYNNGWYLHTDGYFYYIGDTTQTATGGGVLLAEVDATLADKVVPFIDKPIKFPTSVTETYSGYTVGFKVKFQAIQNYIPDDNGARLPSTITNSLKIFKQFDEKMPTEYTDHAYFNIAKNSDGAWEITPKTKNLPESVLLPSVTPDGEPITVIGNFQRITGVKQLVVPASYTTMIKNAFQYSSVQFLDMGTSNIKVISDEAFANSNLSLGIVMPEELNKIDDSAFNYSEIASISLPESLESIGNYAFSATDLKSVFIPKNVKSIGVGIFNGQPYISSIQVDPENEHYKDYENKVIMTKDGKKIIASVARPVDGNLILDIPVGVEELANSALSNGRYTKVVIPASVNTIGNSVFSSSVTQLEVSENNNTFFSDGYGLFVKDKSRLILFVNKNMEGQTYNFPNELVSIDANALSGVTISSINIGANLKIVSGANSLYNFNVGQIIINNSNPNIKSVNNLAILSADGAKFFKYANLSLNTTYSVPNGVTYIDKNALAYSDNLVEIILPDGLENANQEAFYDCDKLTTINFPDSYKASGWRVLANCKSLENVTIKGTSGPQTFQNSYKLKNVVYDVSCTSIGYNQFTNVTALQSVTILSPTLPAVRSGDPFDSNKPSATNNYKIYVVDELVEQYRTYSYFANYADYIYPVSQKPAS